METKQKNQERNKTRMPNNKKETTPPVFVLSEMSKEYFCIIFLLKHKTKQRKIVFLD